MGVSLVNEQGAAVPQINMLCSVWALVLLCFTLKADTLGTLFATSSFEVLLSYYEDLPARQKPGGYLRATLLVLTTCVMTINRAVRAFIVPGLCLVAAALNFAGSNNAFDIVLNAVAVGFITELEYVRTFGPSL